MNAVPREPSAAAARFGRLERDEGADLVICHVCGRGFRALGSHVRAHGMTAAEYRDEFGLLRTRALSSRDTSRSRSTAQRAAFESTPRVREGLMVGQAMARDGELTRQARRAAAERGDCAELVREQAERLADGRRTQAARAALRLEARVCALGYAHVGAAVWALYAGAGLSLEATARTLGVGHEQMRRLLVDWAVPVRPVGANSSAGRRARVALNDLAAARRVGTDDIGAWLKVRRAEGVTLAELAARTGRSIPWVAARARHSTGGRTAAK
ncbi:MucR family transcriptional regulator [Kitasatospora sp. NPDC096147]|uniref:MucR family transcriptional regulator n=1 Tax=Kitasatospora sp. NPDC096147 TaxID=3364093 RepID=UPI0038101FC7